MNRLQGEIAKLERKLRPTRVKVRLRYRSDSSRPTLVTWMSMDITHAELQKRAAQAMKRLRTLAKDQPDDISTNIERVDNAVPIAVLAVSGAVQRRRTATPGKLVRQTRDLCCLIAQHHVDQPGHKNIISLDVSRAGLEITHQSNKGGVYLTKSIEVS